MTKRNALIISTTISLILVFLSFALGCIVLFNDTKPYLVKNSVVYHLDETKAVTGVEITISNPTSKNIKTQDLIIRYCREDRYPEGYSSPIAFSLKPYETKTILITEFRNDWFYNQSYHLETDSIDSHNISLDMENYKPYSEIGLVCLIVFPIALAGFTACLFRLLIEIKRNKCEN